MKKIALLSSIVTILLCLSLIAGSTFALFTSKSNVNIAVTAGEVDMVAGIAITKLESVKGDVNGTIVDENGNTYSYEEVSPNFTNGGTAEVVGSVLTLDKITPGDKVTFEISGTNNSNVAIQYRYVIECLSGDDLMKGLELTINNVAIDKYMESYTSPWAPLAVGTSMTNVPITIELPVSAGNEFQKKSTEIRVLVEAVQGNAVVDANTDPVITYYNTAATAEELAEVLADPYIPYVTITENLTYTIGDLSNKTIDAAGNDVALTFTGTLDNVVVKNIVATGAGTSINLKSATATGELTIADSTFISGAGHAAAGIGLGNNVNVVIDNCNFTSNGGDYGLSNSGATAGIKITNSTFTGFDSWAILVNDQVNGDLIVDNCTFNTPDGVLKTLGGGVKGDFTFTNNTMIGCKGHDGNSAKLLVSGSGTGPVICTGTKTISGNTLDGVEWTQ